MHASRRCSLAPAARTGRAGTPVLRSRGHPGRCARTVARRGRPGDGSVLDGERLDAQRPGRIRRRRARSTKPAQSKRSGAWARRDPYRMPGRARRVRAARRVTAAGIRSSMFWWNVSRHSPGPGKSTAPTTSRAWSTVLTRLVSYRFRGSSASRTPTEPPHGPRPDGAHRRRADERRTLGRVDAPESTVGAYIGPATTDEPTAAAMSTQPGDSRLCGRRERCVLVAEVPLGGHHRAGRHAQAECRETLQPYVPDPSRPGPRSGSSIRSKPQPAMRGARSARRRRRAAMSIATC